MAKKKSVEKEEGKKSESFMGFFPKLKSLYFHPNKFLKSVEGEKNYLPLLRAYVLFYLSYMIIASLVSFLHSGFSISAILTSFILGLVFALVMVFGCSVITYVGVLIFRGKREFLSVFKVVVYTLIIGVIYSFISLIILQLLSLIFPFDISLLEKIKNVE